MDENAENAENADNESERESNEYVPQDDDDDKFAQPKDQAALKYTCSWRFMNSFKMKTLIACWLALFFLIIAAFQAMLSLVQATFVRQQMSQGVLTLYTQINQNLYHQYANNYHSIVDEYFTQCIKYQKLINLLYLNNQRYFHYDPHYVPIEVHHQQPDPALDLAYYTISGYTNFTLHSPDFQILNKFLKRALLQVPILYPFKNHQNRPFYYSIFLEQQFPLLMYPPYRFGSYHYNVSLYYQRPWFQGAIDCYQKLLNGTSTQEYSITEPYLCNSLDYFIIKVYNKMIGITISSPVLNLKNELVGVQAIDYDLFNFNQMIKTYSDKFDSVLLTNKFGMLLAHQFELPQSEFIYFQNESITGFNGEDWVEVQKYASNQHINSSCDFIIQDHYYLCRIDKRQNASRVIVSRLISKFDYYIIIIIENEKYIEKLKQNNENIENFIAENYSTQFIQLFTGIAILILLAFAISYFNLLPLERITRHCLGLINKNNLKNFKHDNRSKAENFDRFNFLTSDTLKNLVTSYSKFQYIAVSPKNKNNQCEEIENYQYPQKGNLNIYWKNILYKIQVFLQFFNFIKNFQDKLVYDTKKKSPIDNFTKWNITFERIQLMLTENSISENISQRKKTMDQQIGKISETLNLKQAIYRSELISLITKLIQKSKEKD